MGLPPSSNDWLPSCFGWSNYTKPCQDSDMYDALSRQKATFVPNQQASYSNEGFDLLGMVVAEVSGMDYSDYVTKHILDKYAISSGATFNKPSDSHAVLPLNNSFYWDVDLNLHRPAGGLYATTTGLSHYLAHLLNNAAAPSLAGPSINMFAPHAYNFGTESAYGLTWEIFRASRILPSNKPVTFFTKGGGHPGYITNIIAVPDYGIGMTILVAGNHASELLDRIRDIVTVDSIRALDTLATRQVTHSYTGIWTFDDLLSDRETKGWQPNNEPLDSSLILDFSDELGLHVNTWISNGSDLMAHLLASFYEPQDTLQLQLIPVDQGAGLARSWRGILQRPPPRQSDSVWDDFCVNDLDTVMYDNRPLFEFQFDDMVQTVNLTGLGIRLRRQVAADSADTLRRGPLQQQQEDARSHHDGL
jgi:hypothetical protein